MKIKVVLLADYPEFIPIAAEWMKEFWGARYPDRTLKQWEQYIYPNKGTLPLTVIAIDFEHFFPRFVGMATLKYDALFGLPEKAEWLSGVFVIPLERNIGIASKLIKVLISIAQEKNVNDIYLFTRTNGEIYKKLGWEITDTPLYQGGKVLLMNKSLLINRNEISISNCETINTLKKARL